MTPRAAQPEESTYREARREALLKVSAELIARKGFAKTTVREIGDVAGILSGSLYYYFDTKEAIVEQIVVKLQAHLWERYDAVIASSDSPRSKLEQVVRISLRAIHEYNDEVRIYQNERQLLESNDRFRALAARSKDFEAMVTRFLVDGIAAGEFRSDLNVPVTFRFIRDSVWPVVHWYRPGGELGIEEVATGYLSLLFDGMASAVA